MSKKTKKKGADAALQGQPRQAPQHGPRLILSTTSVCHVTVSTSVPPTRREDVVDTYHDTAVGDPYRWLEDGDDAEVVAWVAAQNALTRSALDVPARAAWHQRLVALMELPVLQHATLRGDQPVLLRASCRRRAVRARPPRPPAILRRRPSCCSIRRSSSEDAATAIDWYFPSNDGSLVAVGVSEGGTEHSVLHLISGADGSPAGGDGDRIPDTRACSVAWEPDGSGFFYIRYPSGRRVQPHRPPSPPRHPTGATTRWCGTTVPTPRRGRTSPLTPDGRWLVVHVEVGYQRTDVHVLDRRHDDWATVVTGVDATTSFSVSCRRAVARRHHQPRCAARPGCPCRLSMPTCCGVAPTRGRRSSPSVMT